MKSNSYVKCLLVFLGFLFVSAISLAGESPPKPEYYGVYVWTDIDELVRISKDGVTPVKVKNTIKGIVVYGLPCIQECRINTCFLADPSNPSSKFVATNWGYGINNFVDSGTLLIKPIDERMYLITFPESIFTSSSKRSMSIEDFNKVVKEFEEVDENWDNNHLIIVDKDFRKVYKQDEDDKNHANKYPINVNNDTKKITTLTNAYVFTGTHDIKYDFDQLNCKFVIVRKTK